VPGKRAC
jgi:hypothetical protein